jgi:hypothetical protein
MKRFLPIILFVGVAVLCMAPLMPDVRTQTTEWSRAWLRYHSGTNASTSLSASYLSDSDAWTNDYGSMVVLRPDSFFGHPTNTTATMFGAHILKTTVAPTVTGKDVALWNNSGSLYVLSSNGIAGSPYASMMLSTNVVVAIANTNTTYNITGFDYISTNGFTYGSATSSLTNTYAGTYGITIAASVSGITGGNDTFEVALMTNGVEVTQIHFIRRMGAGGDVGSGAATGVIFLPAGTQIQMGVHNLSDADDPTFRKAALRIGAP